MTFGLLVSRRSAHVPAHPPHPLNGLYLILDAVTPRKRPLRDVLRAALGGGVRLVQFRTKQASLREAYEEGVILRRIAAVGGALFIVNDRCDLALALEADGVHLGQQDLPLEDARRILGANRIIGISTHTPEQVRRATEGGADYLGFGPIYHPTSKPDHEAVVGLEGLRHVRPLTDLPLFAIGGITSQRAPDVLRAGADGVAVISAILDAPDIETAVRAFIPPAASARSGQAGPGDERSP